MCEVETKKKKEGHIDVVVFCLITKERHFFRLPGLSTTFSIHKHCVGERRRRIVTKVKWDGGSLGHICRLRRRSKRRRFDNVASLPGAGVCFNETNTGRQLREAIEAILINKGATLDGGHANIADTTLGCHSLISL